MPCTEVITRRQSVPVIYVKGTNYEVGYSVGRTFASLVHGLVNTSYALNKEYIPIYETPKGKEVYEETLAAVTAEFPQYIKELQGTADGAKVPFYKLFLLHMDEIIKVGTQVSNGSSTGCSTICVNQPDAEVLGHTEDTFPSALNNWYVVSAHVINEQPQGKWGVVEERFTSVCYAGHLPGYCSNYNHHGLVFSINTLSAKNLRSGKIPRHFLTRALLSAENMVQAQRILRHEGVGAGDGCSVNMTFLKQEGDRLFHNAEMGPADPKINPQESMLNILTASPGEHIIHCNTYQRLNAEQVADTEGIVVNSKARQEVLTKFPTPICKEDVITMLGDKSGDKFYVFQDYETIDNDCVLTISVGIFDCIQKTWSIYADNPKTNDPLVVLPIILKK